MKGKRAPNRPDLTTRNLPPLYRRLAALERRIDRLERYAARLEQLLKRPY